MAEKKFVIMSGTSFSFLMYEIMKSNTGQEGFLLGECIENEKKTITDSDESSVTFERIVRINSVLSCPECCYFYNSAGVIDKEKLNLLFKDQTSKVVGWYRYRHMASNELTLRDKIIHKQLMNFFSTPNKLFTCGLLTIDNSNQSTHKFKQTFLQYNNQAFLPVSFRILNLSDINYSYKAPQRTSKLFENTLSSLQYYSEDLNTIESIQNGVQTYLDKLVKEIAEDEETVYNLEQEVKELQKVLAMKKNILDNVNDEIEHSTISNKMNSNEFEDSQQTDDTTTSVKDNLCQTTYMLRKKNK